MHRAGTSSWRFAESEPQMPHVALFVRDSVGLPVPPAADVPPALVGGVPDHSAVLSDTDRAEAGEHWLTWWRQLVAHEFRRRPEGLDARTRARQLLDEMRQIVDPPDFTALADRPALRTAVASTFFQACRWSDEARRPSTQGQRALFAWSLVRDVAEDVAFDHGVDVGDVDGAVLVLAVEGMWSYLPGSGKALCSTATGTDALAAHALLRDVFTSQLRQ